MAEVIADRIVSARYALKTLSRPMRDALRSAPRRDGILTLDCEVGTVTVVALIRRGLVESGANHPLTGLGLEVRTLLKGQRAWEVVLEAELPDTLKFAMLRPTTRLDNWTVRKLCERGLLARDMGGQGVPVQTAKGREFVQKLLDELGLVDRYRPTGTRSAP